MLARQPAQVEANRQRRVDTIDRCNGRNGSELLMRRLPGGPECDSVPNVGIQFIHSAQSFEVISILGHAVSSEQRCRA